MPFTLNNESQPLKQSRSKNILFEDGMKIQIQGPDGFTLQNLKTKLICKPMDDAGEIFGKLFHDREFKNFVGNIVDSKEVVVHLTQDKDHIQNANDWDFLPDEDSQYFLMKVERVEGPELTFTFPETISIQTKSYTLTGFGVHGGAHWFTFLQDENKWIKVDDSTTAFMGDYSNVVNSLKKSSFRPVYAMYRKNN